VEFYKGTTLLSTDTNEPYSFVWNDANYSPDGNLTLTAKAYDDSWQSTDSAPIHLFSDPKIWYVDDNASSGGDGSSWTTAFSSLQNAIDNPSLGPSDRIWVAEGTYRPTGGGSERYKTFQLNKDVEIYGGFQTGGGNRDANIYKTILSGDIDDDGTANNSYHVVTVTTTDAILDGFTITDGNADYSSNNYDKGGGIYCSSASPTISNCVIKNNKAKNHGAGMYNSTCSPTVTGCTFIGILLIAAGECIILLLPRA